MKIIRLNYTLEYPPANIKLYEGKDITEEECRAIVGPIILALTKILPSSEMMRLTFAARELVKISYLSVVGYWERIGEEYL